MPKIIAIIPIPATGEAFLKLNFIFLGVFLPVTSEIIEELLSDSFDSTIDLASWL